MTAWICPKCTRVWGPMQQQCQPCNEKVAAGEGKAPPNRARNVVTQAHGPIEPPIDHAELARKLGLGQHDDGPQ